MNTIRNQIIALLVLVVGIFLFGGGTVGLYSLYTASQNYERTVGVVRKFQTKRIYRYRKMRYESRMQVVYPTTRYGEMSVSKISHWPFRSVGDKLTIWYRPDRPHEIRLPKSECMLWGSLVVLGLICIYSGIIIWRISGTADKTKKSNFNN